MWLLTECPQPVNFGNLGTSVTRYEETYEDIFWKESESRGP